MSRRSRSFYLAVILVGVLSPVTGLDDATAAAMAPDFLATVVEPDVDSACPNDHPSPVNADSILPPHSGSGASLVLLRRAMPSMGQGASENPALSFRIPRAPPVG